MSSTVPGPRVPAPSLEDVLPHLSEVCLLLDTDGGIVWASPNTAGLLGHDPDELQGTRLADHVAHGDAGSMVDSGDDVPMVVRIAHPYRPNLWASLRRIPRDDAHTLCLLQDVTAHRELELQLERTAHEDDLTGVANRATTLRALRTEVARAHRYDRPLAMLLLDVDGLRHVNQAHGTEGGDLVLELVARTLDGCVRGMDFVGRTDADEFAMLLPETDIDGALRLAERVRSSVAGLCVRLPGGMARVTASVGVAIIDVDDDVERLLARAGTAIGQVKLTGGNRVGVAQTRIS